MKFGEQRRGVLLGRWREEASARHVLHDEHVTIGEDHRRHRKGRVTLEVAEHRRLDLRAAGTGGGLWASALETALADQGYPIDEPGAVNATGRTSTDMLGPYRAAPDRSFNAVFELLVHEPAISPRFPGGLRTSPACDRKCFAELRL